MPRHMEPISLIEAKGRKHLTKEEIAIRREQEITVDVGAVSPPTYLNEAQKKKFRRTAELLVAANIFCELDCEALGRYLVAETFYKQATEEMRKALTSGASFADIDKLVNQHDKFFKQCTKAANELGLTITGRCKLVVPKKEKEPDNKFSKFA